MTTPGIISRTPVAENLSVTVRIHDGELSATWESTAASSLGVGYEAETRWSFTHTGLVEVSLEDALGELLAAPPDEWRVRFLASQQENEDAAWAEVASGLIDPLAQDLRAEIDRQVEEIVGEGLDAE